MIGYFTCKFIFHVWNYISCVIGYFMCDIFHVWCGISCVRWYFMCDMSHEVHPGSWTSVIVVISSNCSLWHQENSRLTSSSGPQLQIGAINIPIVAESSDFPRHCMPRESQDRGLMSKHHACRVPCTDVTFCPLVLTDFNLFTSFLKKHEQTWMFQLMSSVVWNLSS